jgi:hypothetical protein
VGRHRLPHRRCLTVLRFDRIGLARPGGLIAYRYVTVEQIGYAVDLLPPRSQAFAAVLCDGTLWRRGLLRYR